MPAKWACLYKQTCPTNSGHKYSTFISFTNRHLLCQLVQEKLSNLQCISLSHLLRPEPVWHLWFFSVLLFISVTPILMGKYSKVDALKRLSYIYVYSLFHPQFRQFDNKAAFPLLKQLIFWPKLVYFNVLVSRYWDQLAIKTSFCQSRGWSYFTEITD